MCLKTLIVYLFYFFRSSYVYASHYPRDILGKCKFSILLESLLDTASPLPLPVATVTISHAGICPKDSSQSPMKNRFYTGERECSMHNVDLCENALMIISTIRKENDFYKGLQSSAEAIILRKCLL